MIPHDGHRRAGAAYRLLLRMLPASFRTTYGSAMEDTFAAAHASAKAKGLRALLNLYRRELFDLMRTAVVLRLGTRKRDGHRSGPWLGTGSLRDALRMLRRQPFHAV